jgi:hypothetical protein
MQPLGCFYAGFTWMERLPGPLWIVALINSPVDALPCGISDLQSDFSFSGGSGAAAIDFSFPGVRGGFG